MTEISNEVLAVLVIAAMAISLAGTLSTLSYLGAETPITGLYSGITNVTVERLTAIEVLVALVDFHEMVQEATNDTSDYSPHPFVLKNNGTTFVNITVWSEDLWAAKPNPDKYYMVNASDDNATNTALSTLQSGWVTPWINMDDDDPITPNLATCVNNSPNANTINVHINITVPTQASSGTHTATVTFLGEDPLQGTCGAGT
jgi:hypothetical protein